MDIQRSSLLVWGKVLIVVAGVFLLSGLVPSQPLDPWGLLNLNKFFQLVGSLLLIQVVGVLLVRWLGRRHGLLLTGFLGGLVSSTALTASIARQNAGSTHKTPAEMLPFLSATLAMLCEALLFVYIGTTEFHWQLGILFLGPILVTLAMIVFFMRKNLSFSIEIENNKLVDLGATFKLVIFIMGILGVSKIVQKFAGQTGLQALTFLISLFEIHGSIISNTQLYDGGDLSLSSFGLLLSISMFASYVSKVFLIAMLGNLQFRKYAVYFSSAVTVVLIFNYLVFRSFI